jgi:Mg-chelatase subunit ChlD
VARDLSDPPRPPLVVADLGKQPVEVVFCIDTTGSMGGLLDGAKKKIWSICNQIAGGRPTPDLRVGLVAFRDKGDDYVTKVFDLTDDLDSMNANLGTLAAAGGGDIPESVNQALDDAVNKVKWSSDKKTLRIIFLVGDAPPHMDYTDDVKYPVTCKKALEKGIIINTIQCGSDADCTRYWKDICAKAGGEYAVIPLAGGVRVVTTPFDKDLADLNAEFLRTVVVYGPESKRTGDLRTLEALKTITGASAADRAAFFAKSGRVAPFDLIDAIKAKKVKLEALKPAELPPELAKLGTLRQCRDYLRKIEKKRAELSKKGIELDKKRAAHIAEELKGKGKDSFDDQVLQMLRKQAKKFDIEY